MMYADNITQSMERAINETERRRIRQLAYNEEHHIDPIDPQVGTRHLVVLSEQARRRASAPPAIRCRDVPRDVLIATTANSRKKMRAAAARLEFEKAAALRDELWELRKQLPDGGDPRSRVRRRACSARRCARPRCSDPRDLLRPRRHAGRGHALARTLR